MAQWLTPSHQEGPPFEARNQVRSFLCGVCKFSGFSYPWKPCCVNPAYVQPTLLYMYLYLQPPRCSKYWKAINWSTASLINTRCGWSFFLSRPLSVSLLCVFLYLWQPACTWMHALTHTHTLKQMSALPPLVWCGKQLLLPTQAYPWQLDCGWLTRRGQWHHWSHSRSATEIIMLLTSFVEV